MLDFVQELVTCLDVGVIDQLCQGVGAQVEDFDWV